MPQQSGTVNMPKKRIRSRRVRNAQAQLPVHVSYVNAAGYPRFRLLYVRAPAALEHPQVKRYCAAYSGRLIPARGMQVPEWMTGFLFDARPMDRRLIFTDALQRLKQLCAAGIRTDICVTDSTMCTEVACAEFLRYAGHLDVITQNEQGLKLLREEAMESYGAFVGNVQNADYNGKYGILLDFDSGAFVCTGDACKDKRLEHVVAQYPLPAEALLKALPADADLRLITAAMYEICGFFKQ